MIFVVGEDLVLLILHYVCCHVLIGVDGEILRIEDRGLSLVLLLVSLGNFLPIRIRFGERCTRVDVLFLGLVG